MKTGLQMTMILPIMNNESVNLVLEKARTVVYVPSIGYNLRVVCVPVTMFWPYLPAQMVIVSGEYAKIEKVLMAGMKEEKDREPCKDKKGQIPVKKLKEAIKTAFGELTQYLMDELGLALINVSYQDIEGETIVNNK